MLHASHIYLTSLSNTIDKNLIKILKYFDLDFKHLNSASTVESRSCLFLNCGDFDPGSYNISFKEIFLPKFSYIFFYNLSSQSFSFVSHLTETPLLLHPKKKGGFLYKVSEKKPDLCRQLSGHSFVDNSPSGTSVFEYAHAPYESLIDLDEEPFFIYWHKNSCDYFAVANKSIIDLDQEVISADFNLAERFSEIAPVLMFLKHSLKETLWHAPADYACFIIDDPVLKMQYGFLNFQKLLSVMEEYDFCANIAFIPYNFERSSKEVASLFNGRQDKYSMSIHGCDHGEAEFGISDEKELNRRVKLAQFRMDRHKTFTGIKHNDVLIFPQGAFSSTSLKVLKANNYLSAINKKVIADDVGRLPLSAFLGPAVMDYGFPLFSRRYPQRVSDFALDAFLGKPVFIVEHHGYFKDNYESLRRLMADFNRTFNGLKWRSPEDIMKNVRLERKQGDSTHLKIYTNHATIKNESDEEISYIITKQEDGTVPIERILINGIEQDISLENNSITLRKVAKPNETLEIRIYYTNCFETNKDPGPLYAHKLRMRRFLSEVRDNHLSKHESLAKLAPKAKALIKKITA
jgi:hypothetical protein